MNLDKNCRLQTFERHPKMLKGRFSPSTSSVTGGLLSETQGMHDNPSIYILFFCLFVLFRNTFMHLYVACQCFRTCHYQTPLTYTEDSLAPYEPPLIHTWLQYLSDDQPFHLNSSQETQPRVCRLSSLCLCGELGVAPQVLSQSGTVSMLYWMPDPLIKFCIPH